MVSSAIKGRAWTRKEDEALCRAYRWVSEDSVRGTSQTSEGVCQAEKLYMEGSSKPFQFHGYPPQHRVGPTPVFGIASSIVDGDEDGSLTIQETRVENSSSGEGSIPKAMGRSKARRLKENGRQRMIMPLNMKRWPHCD
ncbi:nodulin-26-like [Pyrus ussuriensis x Pyrus communis]|uniref:Nodulin-26-like n=1 Tax=Pyrus ussuriensis x Pyrus communis TaxID=2448454 RepID=A0A5N5GJ79_9ROSA|nr:nodulin-26-like [Pyrus ussuriensis x Pyrus communis]